MKFLSQISLLFLDFRVIVTPSVIYAKIGQNVQFKCTVEPLALLETISISWSKSSKNSPNNILTSMRTLTVAQVKSIDAGEYVCTGLTMFVYIFCLLFLNYRCLFTTGESGSVTSRAFGNLTIIKCDENEFTCTKDGSCIDETKRCNLFQDCPNNEDELNCRK